MDLLLKDSPTKAFTQARRLEQGGIPTNPTKLSPQEMVLGESWLALDDCTKPHKMPRIQFESVHRSATS